MKDKSKGLQQLRKKAQEIGKGIHLIFVDHLSCDAIQVIILDEGENTETELIPYGACLNYKIHRLMDNYPHLKVYGYSQGWRTFPMEWRDVTKLMRDYILPVEAELVQIELIDSQN